MTGFWPYLLGAIAGYFLDGARGLVIGLVVAWVLMWVVVIVGSATGLIKPEEEVSPEAFAQLRQRVEELEERLQRLESPVPDDDEDTLFPELED